MSIQPWFERAKSECRKALTEPAIEQVGAILDQAGVPAASRAKALGASAQAQSPSVALRKLQDLTKQAGVPEERFPLERKLLLEQALASLPKLDSLPVDDTVKQLFCKEIQLIAEPPAECLYQFSMDTYTFTAFAKITLLNRFPAGHYHWEISGFPRSWLPKIPFRLLPLTIRFLLKDARGLQPWFVSHLRGTGLGTPFLLESEFKKSFYRMALALEKQPRVRAVMAQSWLHSPETHRVSPHLAFLNRIFVEAGGIVTDLGPSQPDDGFAAGNKLRAELYRTGAYKPTTGVAACSRAQAVAWAKNHPELEAQIAVK